IMPARNEKDLIDIPANVKSDIRFIFAKKVEDVLGFAIMKDPKEAKTPKEIKEIKETDRIQPEA
ncbi:MAG: S16 family serine protease, partial [Myxococcaceae bacterium]